MKRSLLGRMCLFLCLVFLVMAALVACETVSQGNMSSNHEYRIRFYTDGQYYHSDSIVGGEEVQLPPAPYKAGATFDGWYYDEGKWSRSFSSADFLYCEPTEDVTVYAKWTEGNAYLIRFDTRGLCQMSPQTVLEGEYPDEPAVPTADGYIFRGWYLESDCQTEWSAATAHPLTADMTLYALWEAVAYTATFVVDGEVVDAVSFTLDSGITPPLNPPERVGYHAAWGDLTPIAANMTVEALYTPIDYRILYEGVEGAENPNPVTITVEDTVYLQPAMRDNHRFVGWYLGDTPITELVAVTEELTLTACWDRLPITITYADVAADEHGNPSVYSVQDGAVSLSPAARSWYTFTGWFLDAAHTRPITELTEAMESDVTLYAAWTPTTYTIEYRADGKTVDTRTFDVEHQRVNAPTPPVRNGYTAEWESVTLAPSDLIVNALYMPIHYAIDYSNLFDGTHGNPTSYTVESSPLTLAPATRVGYDFVGWQSGDEMISAIPAGSFGDLTLTAVWTPHAYKITYKDLFDADASTLPATYTMDSLPLILPIPTRAGYTFMGWYRNNQKMTSLAVGTTGDITLTARWSQDAFAITYMGVEGAENPNPLGYTTADGTITLLPATRRGYTFMGWTRNDRPITAIPAGTTGAVTLTATWVLNTYTITYKDIGTADISSLPTTYTVESDTIRLPALSVNGMTFKGWVRDGETVTAIPAGSIGDITLTALWDATTYTITYTGVDSSEHTNPTAYTLAGGTISLSPATRRGYAFRGWLWNGQVVDILPAGTTGNLSLQAQWELLTYTITYENTKGADTTSFPKTYTVKSSTIRLPDTLLVEGYTFKGWKNADGMLVSSIPAGSVGDITLSASFVTPSCAVNLHPMGGVLSNTLYTVWAEESFKLPVPHMEGYVFKGWYTSTAPESERMTDADGYSLAPYPTRSDGIFYAHYTPILLTITFVENSGSTVESAVYAYGSYFDPEAHKTTAGTENLCFDGWYTENGIRYTEGTRLTAAVTLHARWLHSMPIRTAEDLLSLVEDPAGTYHLVNDITLSGGALPYIPEFTGVLNGGGYTIRNFTLSNTESDIFAMFGTNKGTIRNLTLESFSYSISYTQPKSVYFGVLTAVNEGTVESCTIRDALIRVHTLTQNVTLPLYWGSVAGVNRGTIRTCTTDMDAQWMAYSDSGYRVNSNVSAHYGGVVGFNEAAGVMSYCNAYGTFTAYIEGAHHASGNIGWNAYTHMYGGGIVGTNDGTIDHALADNTVSVTHGMASHLYAGGFAGLNRGSISASSAKKAVTGGAQNSIRMGGFIGYNEAAGVIGNCHAAGNVEHASGAAGGVGGFIGENYGKLMNDYATGRVHSHAGTSVGGFVGINSTGGTITQSFCSGGEVVKAEGNGGRFVGSYNGSAVAHKCFFLASSTLMINGTYSDSADEHDGTVVGLSYALLFGEDLLIGQLEWNQADWVILIDEAPVQNWELNIGHTYQVKVIRPTCETLGFSINTCTHCGRCYLSDFVPAQGHTYNEGESTTQAPTCDFEGYSSRVCTRCNYEDRFDITPHLEHERAEDIDYRAATCTEDGMDQFRCAHCDQIITLVLKAEGHVAYVSAPAIAPVCRYNADTGLVETTPGATAEHSCYICREVITPSTPIEPHQFEVTPITPATCTTDGYGTYTCILSGCGFSENRAIPRLGHTDLNYDGCCDRESCHAYIGNEDVIFIDIATAEDLQLINRIPNGAFRLIADIDLGNTPFTPLCSANTPFTGYFDGNGKTIRNLLLEEQAVGGLFAANDGVICNLTIDTLTVRNNKRDGLVGGIAGYNAGNISNCQIVGGIQFITLQSMTVTEKDVGTYERIVRFGSVVGLNEPTGVICDTEVSGSIRFHVQNIVSMNTNFQYFSFLYVYDSMRFDFNLTASMGAVAANNSGLILRCTVSSREVVYTGDNTGYRIPSTHGYLTISRTLYVGNFAADNQGRIESCIGGISHIHTEDLEQFDKQETGQLFRIEGHLYRYVDGVAVAVFMPDIE